MSLVITITALPLFVPCEPTCFECRQQSDTSRPQNKTPNITGINSHVQARSVIPLGRRKSVILPSYPLQNPYVELIFYSPTYFQISPNCKVLVKAWRLFTFVRCWVWLDYFACQWHVILAHEIRSHVLGVACLLEKSLSRDSAFGDLQLDGQSAENRMNILGGLEQCRQHWGNDQ